MRVQLRAGFLVLQASRLSGRPQSWLARPGELSTGPTEPILHAEGVSTVARQEKDLFHVERQAHYADCSMRADMRTPRCVTSELICPSKQRKQKITPVVSGGGLSSLLHLEQGSHGFVFDLIS